MKTIVAISDTHNRHDKLTIPECDFLFHCGDWTGRGYFKEVMEFAEWLDKQPAKHIVIIPGNHELEYEKQLPLSREWITNYCPRAVVLNDSYVVIDDIKIYGSPVQPWFCDWAFNRARNEKESLYRNISEIKPHWDMIPDDTDILLTHGPPYEILDELVYMDGTPKGQFVGCEDLLKKVKEVRPDLHFFGHIHSHGGKQRHIDGTSFYNASICDEIYYPSNPLTIVEYEKTNT